MASFTFGAYRFGAGFARTLPHRAIPFVERAGGYLAARAMESRRIQVERNIRRIYGTTLSNQCVSEIVHETFTSYARYWIESFRLPGMNPDEIDAGVEITNFSAITDALAVGKGAILALPHLGGWEWGAFWLAAVQHIPVSAVAEAVEPPELAEWFLTFRRSIGIDLIPLDTKAGTASSRALRENRLLCLVCDRDIVGGGIPVQFFGETTTLPAGPATLALRTGAPILPTATYFDGHSHRFEVLDAVDATRQGSLREDVTRITQAIAMDLEMLIRKAPEQWHILQPNWPSDLHASTA